MLRAYSRVLIVLILLATALVPPVEAGVLDPDVMKVALHTATPQEGGFIEYVVARVDKGTLPLDLVQSTFLWARKRPRKKFYYFKQALILRAAAQGIRL
jgi:hypothetical protein